MTVRLFITAAVLLGIYVGARWAAGHGMPTEPAPLEMKAQDLPTTLGEWKGADSALDKELFNAVGAETQVDRQYRDGRGRNVSLHFAVFEKSQDGHLQVPPHPPENCYPAGGWTLGEPKSVSFVQGGAATENAGKLMPVERRGEKGYVLYWYQIDGTAYYDGNRQRNLLLACRGRPVRPPIVKVMLHTMATDPDEAEKTLKSLADEVYKWSRGFH